MLNTRRANCDSRRLLNKETTRKHKVYQDESQLPNHELAQPQPQTLLVFFLLACGCTANRFAKAQTTFYFSGK